jgi:hypothetical protein
MEDKTPTEAERQREEPAWERVLKSPVTGVVIGALLTLGANFVLEGSRARERARDAQQQRLQGTLQIVDDLAALVYEYQVQLKLHAVAAVSGSMASISERYEGKKLYEASYTKFSTQAPVLLLKLRNRINPKYYKAVADRFYSGVESYIRESQNMLERAAMHPQKNIDDVYLEASLMIEKSRQCSYRVIDFIYAAAADSSSLDDTETQIERDCGWTRRFGRPTASAGRLTPTR